MKSDIGWIIAAGGQVPRYVKILVCEDEPEVASFLRDALTEVGFEVETTGYGDEALHLLTHHSYNAVILDRMLPGMDGVTVLREARKRGLRTPVLFLTAKFKLEEKIEGLDAGANDYLVKPFALGEFLARVRALLRQSVEPAVLKSGGIELDPSSRRVVCNGHLLFLSATEFALLHYLMSNEGRIVSRTQILKHVWDDHGYRGSNVVDVYVNYLRGKLGAELIATVRGEGYVFGKRHEA